MAQKLISRTLPRKVVYSDRAIGDDSSCAKFSIHQEPSRDIERRAGNISRVIAGKE